MTQLHNEDKARQTDLYVETRISDEVNKIEVRACGLEVFWRYARLGSLGVGFQPVLNLRFQMPCA
jgi:hypothetical protein